MTARRLELVGWVCLASGVLGLPLMLLYHFAVRQDGGTWHALGPLAPLTGLMLSLFIIQSLRTLLRSEFHYQDAEGLLITWMLYTAISSVLSLVVALVPDLQNAAVIGLPVLVLALFGAVLYILLAASLWRAAEQFQPLRPYSIVLGAQGVLFLTIVLVPFTAVTGIVADIILGVGLLELARQKSARARLRECMVSERNSAPTS